MNGSISGAPSAAGAFNVALSATNAGGTATAQLSVIITAPAPGSAPGLKAAIAFPNPAVRADPTLRAFMGGVSSLTITIFNAHGRVVHSATISGSPTGTLNGQPYYDYVWSGDKASGVYFAVIHGKAADGTVVRARVKLAVVR